MSDGPIKGYTYKRDRERDPDDPVWQAIVEMRQARIEEGRKSLEEGRRYRDPYEDFFNPPRRELWKRKLQKMVRSPWFWLASGCLTVASLSFLPDFWIEIPHGVQIGLIVAGFLALRRFEARPGQRFRIGFASRA